MAFHVVRHPIAESILTQLRNRDTCAHEYRLSCRQIASILLIEALRPLELEAVPVNTPLAPCEGNTIADLVTFVVISRAGTAMLGPALELSPEATIGTIGIERDPMTTKAHCYYQKLPEIKGRYVVVLDPMLATGHSAALAFSLIAPQQPKILSLVSVLAAPEGVEHLMKNFPSSQLYAAALDQGLNEQNFIVPGLGDFGDRFYGTL
ncbi:MAG: uracil phosphoribosyltransferase [Verrucomicrobiota bacterium]|nr:MAG: uracil phosphoribosyltransferase [Verrucomicrobiota bacterium]